MPVLTADYKGYNTVGGTWEAVTGLRWYTKKITLTQDGLLSSIEAYIRTNGGQVGAWSAAIFTDNAGTPGTIVGYVTNVSDTLHVTTTGRWMAIPIAKWLTAGDYWISVASIDGAESLEIARDGSGTDRYNSSGNAWWADWSQYTPTTTSFKYSIRAAIIYDDTTADRKFSDLTTVTSLDGTEHFPLNDSGTSKRIDAATLLGIIHDEILVSTAASFDITSIPATYRDLEFVLTARGNDGAANSMVQMTFNNDTGANYEYQQINAGGGSVSGAGTSGASYIRGGYLTTDGSAAGRASHHLIYIPNYAGTTFHKTAQVQGGLFYASGAEWDQWVGRWASTSAISRVTLTPAAGSFKAGSRLTVYGR